MNLGAKIARLLEQSGLLYSYSWPSAPKHSQHPSNYSSVMDDITQSRGRCAGNNFVFKLGNIS